LPHVALLAFMHVPPWQQPLRQLSRLQLPPDDPEELPLDDPEELPLDDPEELPLDEPLDDPEELPLDEPVPRAHDPLWHVWPVTVQSTQAVPPMPHAEVSLPPAQLPLMSQHPPQIAAQPPASSPLASSPMTTEPLLLPLPLPLPLLVLPLPPPLLLEFRPGPLDEEGSDASSGAAASCTTGLGSGCCGMSPSVDVEPVAHAPSTARRSQPTRTVFWSIERMRPRPPTRDHV
jgi:hypothetical protein